jgi:hypothetical protein
MNEERDRRAGLDPQHTVGRFGPGEFEKIERAVLDTLEPLQEVPPRSPSAVQRGRRALIETARKLGVPVSPAPVGRHKRWKIFARKESTPMFTLARIVLVAALVFGGAGSTVAAAQASGPSDALYPVKLWSEDARLALSGDPQTTFNLLMSFVEERMEEVASLTEQQEPVPVRVVQRLQSQVQLSLQEAAKMNDAELDQAMARLQVMVQYQSQVMTQLQARAPEHAEQALQLTERVMAQIRSAAEEAQEDPTSFRLHLGVERLETSPEQHQQSAPGKNAGDGNGEGQGSSEAGGQTGRRQEDPCPTCTPQEMLGTPKAPGGPGGFGPGSNR